MSNPASSSAWSRRVISCSAGEIAGGTGTRKCTSAERAAASGAISRPDCAPALHPNCVRLNVRPGPQRCDGPEGVVGIVAEAVHPVAGRLAVAATIKHKAGHAEALEEIGVRRHVERSVQLDPQMTTIAGRGPSTAGRIRVPPNSTAPFRNGMSSSWKAMWSPCKVSPPTVLHSETPCTFPSARAACGDRTR